MFADLLVILKIPECIFSYHCQRPQELKHTRVQTHGHMHAYICCWSAAYGHLSLPASPQPPYPDHH